MLETYSYSFVRLSSFFDVINFSFSINVSTVSDKISKTKAMDIEAHSKNF